MFNPAKAAQNIKQEFIDYITTSYTFSDPDIQNQLITELGCTIAKGPYLEMKDVFKSGKSIRELTKEGILSELFLELEANKPDTRAYKKRIPVDRPLHLHQENAVRKLVAGENIVVSTGTGSGKTNCFLIPVLNKLLREIEQGTLDSGVRALFIYPMNALANDQIKNIRNILMYYPAITFGVYNGATEEEEAKAIELYEAMYGNETVPELRKRLPNEILSRKEMKRNPPNILFTNYAMLEHLLFRPNDDVLFSEADFSFVVLDEAHVYTGATGIETSMLLRRLKARIATTNGVQFVLTSATLGSGESDDDNIIKFAENLCGVEFKKDNIIRAAREEYHPDDEGIEYPSELYTELVDEQNVVTDVLNKYSLSQYIGKTEEESIYNFIITTNLYYRLRMYSSGITDVTEMTDYLQVDLNTTVSFVSLCTRAQKNGKSLLDARYHYFIRALEGAYITLASSPKLLLNRRKQYIQNDKAYSVFEVAVCNECGKYAVLGKAQDRHLIRSGKLDEVVDYYYPATEYNTEIESEDDESEKKSNAYMLCRLCGALISEKELHNPACDCGVSNYVKVEKAHKLSVGARCGNCNIGEYMRFYLGNDAATSVLATALYEELPDQIYEEVDVQDTYSGKSFLARAALKNKKKETRKVRQFLVFSDSRQEAAKFACYLGDSYEEFLRRRGICQLIAEKKQELINGQFTISDYVSFLSSYFSTKKCFVQNYSEQRSLVAVSQKQAWMAMLNELSRASSATSLTSLGVIQFKYLGNTEDIVNAVANEYGVSADSASNLLDILIEEVVKSGAIATDNPSDIGDEEREYIFYSPQQRFLVKNKGGDRKWSCYSNWLPKNKGGDVNKFYSTNKLYYVKRFLNCDDKKAAEFLDLYFDYLTDPSQCNEFLMQDLNKDGSFVMPARNFAVKIAGDKSIHWYRCTKCGSTSTNHINNFCIKPRCNGRVVEVNPLELSNDNHYAKLYRSDKVSPLLIKEHTAQLSKKEGADYQEKFVKKEINALSCSTTFEMGVDVGDLETVFLRNVPPMPSNYAQRAGRAGRSVNAAAFALTYAKLSSHDFSYFENPTKMIGGIIQPPLFKINNVKIVKRHIYDIAISMFLSEHTDMYDHNDANAFINEKGYLEFIDWLNTKPERLKQMIMRSIPDVEDLYGAIGIEDYSWLNDFIGENGAFTQLINEYENNIAEFNKIINNLKKSDLTAAGYCERKLQLYTSNRLIDFLARGNILPRYGFPVDTVELEQNTTAENVDRLRLTRDLQVAIADYAPSSEVVANGRLYTSRYIKKTSTANNKKDWVTAYIGVCNDPNCQTVNYSYLPVTGEGVPCSACKKPVRGLNFHESIEPRSGFATEKEDKKVPRTKQEKNYKSEDFYIGDVSAKSIEKHLYTINGIKILLESTTNDSLLVKSSISFYVCPRCGFAYAEDESIGDTKAQKDMRARMPSIETANRHPSLYHNGYCQIKKLSRRSLHHKFSTDVAKLSFDCDTSNYNTMYSVMYALLYAISDELNVERRDIKACLSKHVANGIQSFSIIIYDSVPGGAGHSRRLVTSDGKILGRVIERALRRVSSCNCEPSCYNCLRSYENQKHHDILDRQLATTFLEKIAGEVVPVPFDEESDKEYERFFGLIN